MTNLVLIADDSASVRQVVGFTLREAGFEVVEAVDGQDALAKLSPSVSMVITDLNMPNLDGIGLIRAIRENKACKGIPILMLTTESDPGKKSAGRLAGATGWIVKPFAPAQLLAVIRKVRG